MSAPLTVVLFVGIPGSGKSTFFRARFAETHVLVSKDLWPNARHRDRRQARVIDEALAAERSLVVDNTNPTREERAAVIEAARRHGARVVGYYFATPLADALSRNARREGRARVPDAGVHAIAKRMCRPALDDGFDELHCVRLTEGGFAVEAWKGEGDEDR